VAPPPPGKGEPIVEVPSSKGDVGAISESVAAGVAVGARVSERVETLEFAALFRRYAPYVARIGLRILGRPDEVDDLVQDVFLNVHRHLPSLRDPQSVKGWLAAITVRAARRKLRKRRLVEFFTRQREEPDYGRVADEGASQEDRSYIAALFRALETLPVQERVAWSLRHLEGETMERVAELCQCSLSTAKRRVQAAHEMLVQRGVVHGE
jgi:RNA polymerase sigma-70 factor (ECF subfamily)